MNCISDQRKTNRHPRNAINPFHPFFGMWMAITRKTVAGTVLNPEQRIGLSSPSE